MDIVLVVEEKLKKAFPAGKIIVENQSGDHEGHNASGAHIGVQVIDASFNGKSLVEQHKMIYQALGEEMKAHIHALAIDTRTA